MDFDGFDDLRCQIFEKFWKIHTNSCFKSSVENESERCPCCEGVGHTLHECTINLKKKLNKPISHVTTLSDCDSKEEVFYASRREFPICVISDDSESDGSVDESEEESVDEHDLQTAYNELYAETLKTKKENLKLKAQLKECAIKNNDFLVEELRAHVKILKEKLEYVEGERDSLRELMETMKKELLEFEDSR